LAYRRSGDEMRCLDIGPGWEDERIKGFETLDVIERDNVDHVADASKPLPFEDAVFDIIYASHVLEHIEWQYTERTLREWVRILKNGGWLEVWVPNGLKACHAFVEAERGNLSFVAKSPTWKYKIVDSDPCRFANGNIFSFTSGVDYPPWGLHKAMFSPRYLKSLFRKIGLKNVVEMDKKEVRAHHYRWINLGIKGQK